MLHVGDKVPDFELPVGRADLHREKLRLHDVLQKGPVVISFFPLAFTHVCTAQLCDARDSMGPLNTLAAQVLGFSCDSMFTNAYFAKEQGLSFPIWSDANRDVVDKIWASEDVAGVRHVPRRGWMVIAQDGTVAERWLAEAPGLPWPGNAPILAALEKLASR